MKRRNSRGIFSSTLDSVQYRQVKNKVESRQLGFVQWLKKTHCAWKQTIRWELAIGRHLAAKSRKSGEWPCHRSDCSFFKIFCLQDCKCSLRLLLFGSSDSKQNQHFSLPYSSWFNRSITRMTLSRLWWIITRTVEWHNRLLSHVQ